MPLLAWVEAQSLEPHPLRALHMSGPGDKVCCGAVYEAKAAGWNLPCLARKGGPHEIILSPADPSSRVAAACSPKLLGYWYPQGLKVARSIVQGSRKVSLPPGPALHWAPPSVLCCAS